VTVSTVLSTRDDTSEVSDLRAWSEQPLIAERPSVIRALHTGWVVGGARLRNKQHVMLRADDRGQSFTEDRVILHAKDANWLSVGHGKAWCREF
jgi:hypothetical protein